MDSDTPEGAVPRESPQEHLATISHEGRFWEVYTVFEQGSASPGTSRARLRFEPADADERESPVETATIIIEATFEDAMRTARSFADHQLVGLLRSALPDPD